MGLAPGDLLLPRRVAAPPQKLTLEGGAPCTHRPLEPPAPALLPEEPFMGLTTQQSRLCPQLVVPAVSPGEVWKKTKRIPLPQVPRGECNHRGQWVTPEG